MNNTKLMQEESQRKIIPLDEIPRRLAEYRSQSTGKVVHCHGVFDLLHIGHIKHLESARKLGDLLVVTLTPDVFVDKGPGRPAFTEYHRAEALAALGCVDLVAINHWPTAIETLRLVKPDLYVKGSEYREASNDISGKIDQEKAAVELGGGRLAFTDDVVFSSTQLINSFVAPPSPQVQQFVRDFKSRSGFAEMAGFVEGARKLKVLVVGEAIIDEYQYCEALGKSSKEPTLVARRVHLERFAGGSLAVANHLANFVDEVSLVSLLGAQNPQADFIESHLNPNVKRNFVTRKDGPTIVKRRYVEADFFQKLFEMYDLNDVELEEGDKQQLLQLLEILVPQHDVVLVFDYGHGFLGREAIDILCRKSKFLAVNAQTNAGNQGYQSISSYPRADLVAITEREIRLEARRRRGNLEEIVVDVARGIDCPRFCITRGGQGCLTYGKDVGFLSVPALADKVIDRVGAGDAFLSLAALCAAQGGGLDACGLMGNAAGAQAVATVCNKDSVNRLALLKHLQALLK